MDAVLAVLTILNSDTVPGGVVSLVGVDPTTGNPALYGGQLPEHYNPEANSTAEPTADGPAITITVKGGESHNEMPLQNVDVQLKVWAGINDNFTARSIYGRCYQVLDGLYGVTVGAAGDLKRILATIPGIDDVDPVTGWSVCIGAFNVMIMDNGAYPVNIPITPTQTAAQYTDSRIASIIRIDGEGNFS